MRLTILQKLLGTTAILWLLMAATGAICDHESRFGQRNPQALYSNRAQPIGQLATVWQDLTDDQHWVV